MTKKDEWPKYYIREDEAIIVKLEGDEVAAYNASGRPVIMGKVLFEGREVSKEEYENALSATYQQSNMDATLPSRVDQGTQELKHRTHFRAMAEKETPGQMLVRYIQVVSLIFIELVVLGSIFVSDHPASLEKWLSDNRTLNIMILLAMGFAIGALIGRLGNPDGVENKGYRLSMLDHPNSRLKHERIEQMMNDDESDRNS